MSFFNSIPAVSVVEAAQKVAAAGVAFIDVRTLEEYASGHAEGAQNVPLDILDAHVKSLKESAAVYVICRTGGRSGRAVSTLLAAQVPAYNVAGGTEAWRAAGLPVV